MMHDGKVKGTDFGLFRPTTMYQIKTVYATYLNDHTQRLPRSNKLSPKRTPNRSTLSAYCLCKSFSDASCLHNTQGGRSMSV